MDLDKSSLGRTNLMEMYLRENEKSQDSDDG